MPLDDDLKDLRVLVTRPAHQANMLVEHLKQAGAIPVLLPLFSIVTLANTPSMQAALGIYEQADFFIFTSANAVDVAVANIIAANKIWPPAQPVFAVGKATQKYLWEKGCTQVSIPETHFSSEGLMETLIKRELANKTLIIFGGVEPRPLLANTLIEKGAKVISAFCYERKPNLIHFDHKAQKQFLEGIDIILCNSVQTLKQLLQVFDKMRDNQLLNKPFLLGSARIAAYLHDQGYTNLAIIADNPCDNSIMSALTLWHKESHHD